MFGSLARRLTGWYVFVAVALVVLITASIVVTALLLYAKDANEQIAALARQVPDIETRATIDRDDWDAAQALLLRRLARPGLSVRTRTPPPIRIVHESGEYGYFRYPAAPAPGATLPPGGSVSSSAASAEQRGTSARPPGGYVPSSAASAEQLGTSARPPGGSVPSSAATPGQPGTSVRLPGSSGSSAAASNGQLGASVRLPGSSGSSATASNGHPGASVRSPGASVPSPGTPAGPPRPPPGEPLRPLLEPGNRVPATVDVPLFTNRFGYVAASSLGIRPVRSSFFGGVAVIFVDVDRVQAIVEDSLAVVVVTGLISGLAAWAIGRYITSQAMRPLYDVTSALVRFAGRDFSVGPINVASRTEFDELVRAYNAAADQVGAAFAERAVAEGQMRQFVADAGHELRTPLTIVLGYIDILKRRTPEDERTRRIFETIAIEGTRMRTLIDNLVLLARLEGADTRPGEPFALTPLLEDDIVQTRLAIAPDRAIDLNIEVDAAIIGDRSEIYEAIANVVDNALKYAPDAPVRISVRAVPGGVAISVSDRGPGVDAVDREAIFDRFYRGSLRGRFEGSGLGLPIAKRAVERAGGALSLASTSPAGSTFEIRLRADRVTARDLSANVGL